MFKLPELPSPDAGVHELADFAELCAWERGFVSSREIVAYLNRIDDNDNNSGCDDDEDENTALLDEVMLEIDRRTEACRKNYPFVLEDVGSVLKHKEDDSNQQFSLYRYFLVSTRLNMTSSKKHVGIDGTLLLEEIAAHILRNYLGSTRAKSYVFGTAVSGSFSDKVTEMCRNLKEGDEYRNPNNITAQANDDKLDVVAWIPFSDLLSGQVIVFCQCKTGTNWLSQGSQLQPDAFIKKWVLGDFVVNPIRIFCLSEAIDRSQRSRWREFSYTLGIIFDRCRLIDHCGEIPDELLDRINRWTLAAKATIQVT